MGKQGVVSELPLSVEVMGAVCIIWLFTLLSSVNWWFRALREDAAEKAMVVMQVSGAGLAASVLLLVLVFLFGREKR